MKFTTMIFLGLILTAVVITCAGCIFVAGTHKHEECPVEDKEEPQTLFGSHDFFLEGDDKMTSSTLATKCPTCEIYFTHPSYGEHIKTCCP